MNPQSRSRSAKPQRNRVHVVREVTLRYGRLRKLPTILIPADLARFVRGLVDGVREHFVVVYLDGRHTPIGWQVVAVGSANAVTLHPREIFQPAVAIGACKVLLAHNHPSGNEWPSQEDRDVTKRLVDAGTIMGIHVLDHVVVSDKGFWSFFEQGAMPRVLVEAGTLRRG